jgi:hypothetical protein
MTPAAASETTCCPAVPIPPADHVRKRLATVLTEAGVLRRQLKVSTLAEREQDRIRRLTTDPLSEEGRTRG